MTARTHFVRMLTWEQVEECRNMLRRVSNVPNDPTFDIGWRSETFEVKAPDGDVVFSGLRKGDQNLWICRLHRECFDQEVVA